MHWKSWEKTDISFPFYKSFRIIVRQYENNNVKYFTDDCRRGMFELVQSLNNFQNSSTCLLGFSSFSNKNIYNNILKMSPHLLSSFKYDELK